MSRVTALTAEGIGSSLLAATVIGSGVMAERLAGGNAAIALLANTAATVAVLATLVALLGPLSGAHVNPAVSLVQVLLRKLSWRTAAAYAAVQIAGCCLGSSRRRARFRCGAVGRRAAGILGRAGIVPVIPRDRSHAYCSELPSEGPCAYCADSVGGAQS